MNKIALSYQFRLLIITLPMNSHHLYSGMTALNRFVRGFRRQRSANLPPDPQHLERMQVDSVSQRCAWL